MEVVKLTNLGYLTLANLLGLEEKYKENTGLKRKKLSQLWDSEQEMDSFQTLFSDYHSESMDQLLTREGESYVLRDRQLQSDIPLNSNVVPLMERFKEMGLVEFTPNTLSLEETISSLQEERESNPARNLKRAILELTGACNLKCAHCYRGGSRPGEYGLPAETIKEALKPLLRAGIDSIMITGGEPTLRRKDLLDIIDFASQYLELKGVSSEERLERKYGNSNPTIDDVLKTNRYIELREELMSQLSKPKDQLRAGDWSICDENTPKDVDKLLRGQAKWDLEYARKASSSNLDHLSVLSNGFFDEPRELVRTLNSYGVSMQTSLDSFNGHRTNQNRGKAGVFGKVKALVTIAREEHYDLSITAHNIGGRKTRRERENSKYFDRNTPMLVMEGMLQIGNATNNGFEPGDVHDAHNYLGSLSPDGRKGEGWCTGWTAPKDVHIKPTGIVGNCLYAYAIPEEFGNLRQTPMASIINGIQNSRVYAMFTNGRIERYQHELDRSLFPATFQRSCEPMVLTLTYGVVKERLIEQGVENPVQRANEEVARLYKYKK